MSDNLRNKTISAILWSGVEKIGQQIIQFVVIMIIARILLPSDFGLIGMLSIFFAISKVFINSGFGEALIQKKDASHTDFSTIFYFNLILGFICYLLLFVTAPFIADFYNEPELEKLTRFMALNLVFSAFGLIQNTRIKKNIDFKIIARIRLASVLLSGIVGVILAYCGFGVWSLAMHMVTNNLLITLLLWRLSEWRPSAEFSVESFRSLLPFGSRLFVSGLIDQIFQNIYLLVIGKYFSAKELGFYSNAKQIQERPVLTLSDIVSTVIFPAFATIQDDDIRLKAGFKKCLKVLVFMNFPLMVGLFVVADPLVRVLLTEKWLPSVPYIQLLAIIGFIYTLHPLNLNILKVKGRSDLFFKLEIIKKINIVIALIIGIKWGIIGLIAGRIVVAYLGYFINTYYSGMLIGYPMREQLVDMLPYLLISIIMGGLTYFIGHFFVEQHSTKLVVQLMFGVGIYYLLAWIFKAKALIDIQNIAKSIILKIY